MKLDYLWELGKRYISSELSPEPPSELPGFKTLLFVELWDDICYRYYGLFFVAWDQTKNEFIFEALSSGCRPISENQILNRNLFIPTEERGWDGGDRKVVHQRTRSLLFQLFLFSWNIIHYIMKCGVTCRMSYLVMLYLSVQLGVGRGFGIFDQDVFLMCVIISHRRSLLLGY